MPRIILTLLLLSAGWVAAQHRLISHVYDPAKTRSEIRVTALFSELPTSGYMPVRVDIANATKVPRTWVCRFRSFDSAWTDSGNEMRSSFSAPCGAGERASYEFLVPLVTAFQDGFDASTELAVTVTAPAMMPLSASLITTYHTGWPAVAMSADLHTANGSKLDDQARRRLGGGGGHPGHATVHHGPTSNVNFGGFFDPRELSEDWRAYAGLDVLMLSESGWKDARPGARNAILKWNRLGGALLVCAESPSTDLASLGIVPGARGERQEDRSWGRVQVLATGAGRSLDAGEIVTLVGTGISSALGEGTLKSLRGDFAGKWPLQIAFGSKKAHVVFFIIVLIAFGVLVGPVNLFVFAKSGQRHRLFITTPIISAGASLLLVVLILFQDGFGGRGQRMLLVEVRSDDGENAAYLAQEQIARTGVLLSSEFTTSEPGYLTPVLIDDSRWARVTPRNNGGQSRYTSDVLEQGLRVAGDWFQSRSEHGHLIQAIRPTRGRVELSASAPPVVTSTFAFPLEAFYYTDPDGGVWTARDVRQGRSVTLEPVSAPEFNRWLAAQKARFATRNRQRLERTATRPGHFLASSGGVPAIETLRSIDWTETGAVLTGPVTVP